MGAARIGRALREGDGLATRAGGKFVEYRTGNVPLFLGPHRISVWMVLAGMAEMQSAGHRREFGLGGTVVLPAAVADVVWTPGPAATLLVASIEPE